ncbi:hypothetical protein AX774_g4478, partial [Zancudomyces culisetae]
MMNATATNEEQGREGEGEGEGEGGNETVVPMEQDSVQEESVESARQDDNVGEQTENIDEGDNNKKKEVAEAEAESE